MNSKYNLGEAIIEAWSGMKMIQTPLLIMKEKSKYFTPDIEDIRVGYEFENRLSGRDWQKVNISELEALYISSFIGDLKRGNLRVPYLTKEQLEAEGWVYSHITQLDHRQALVFHKDFDEADEFKKKGGFLMDGFSWHWTLFAYDLDQIIIEEEKHGGFMGIASKHTSFWGTCKDINTLRQIQKLINIK